jgi:hypothetical protein
VFVKETWAAEKKRRKREKRKYLDKCPMKKNLRSPSTPIIQSSKKREKLSSKEH